MNKNEAVEQCRASIALALALVIVLVAVVVSLLPSGLRACDPAGGNPPRALAPPTGPDGPRSAWSHLVSLESNNYNPDCNPWVTADQRKLFFISADDLNGPPRPGFQGSWDICEAEWDPALGRWGPAVNLGPPVNTAGPERRPSATVTGDTLFFSRGPYVWIAIRSGGAWGQPVQLFPGSDPCITIDVQQIYFVRNNDIWIADRGSDLTQWLNHRPLPPPVNSQYAEVRPFISFDKTKLFWSDFGVPRPGGYGGVGDLWFSTWTGSSWGPPVNVGPPINTDRVTCTPYLSTDGRRFYTSSESFEGSRGDEDVWVAFLDSLPAPRAIQGGAGVWTKCGELAGAWNVYDLAQGPDGSIYAATSPGGLVYRSDDSGASWTVLPPLPGAFIVYSLLVARDGALYAGTYPLGDVFRSTNRGESWQLTANLPGATAVRALIDTGDGRILAGVSPTGSVLSSTNGGQAWTTWATLPALAGNGITCLHRAANGYLYAGGWGPPYRSTDGGTSWTEVNNTPFPPNELKSIDSFYETRDAVLWATGWVHAHGGYVFRSTNAGASWDTTGSIRIGPVHAVRVYAMDEDPAGNLRIGYQPGPDSVASVSTDRGASWQPEGSLAGAHEVLAFLRTAGGTLYAATTPNGDVFRWSPPAAAAPERAPAGAPAALELGPVAPNPAEASVRIVLRVARAGPATLEVVDVGGRHVRALLASPVAAGEHALVWDGRDDAGRDVASGLYLFRLSGAGETRTRKFALLR